MLREPTPEELAREIATECRPDCRLSLSCNCPRPPQRPRDARPTDEIEPAYCEKIEQLVLGALHRAVKVEREKIAQWIDERSWVRAEVEFGSQSSTACLFDNVGLTFGTFIDGGGD